MQSLLELQDLSIQAAKSVGNFLNQNRYSEKIIFSEEGRDIKIELDQIAETKLRKFLEQTKISILGEEFGSTEESNLTWVIDPIDGTANYYRNLNECCISIALLENTKGLIGTIYNFNTDELYTASKGNGAKFNNMPMNVSSISSRDKAIISTGFPSSEPFESSVKFLEGLREWKKVRMFGSAALSCAYVASGRCDYYAEKGVYLWDFAAGICLVEEAGGKADFSTIDSGRYSVKFSNNFL